MNDDVKIDLRPWAEELRIGTSDLHRLRRRAHLSLAFGVLSAIIGITLIVLREIR